MPGYRRNVVTGKSVPKSTQYYRRKQRNKFLAMRLENAQVIDLAGPSEIPTLQQEGAQAIDLPGPYQDHIQSDIQDSSSDTDGPALIGNTSSMSKRQRKKKPKAKQPSDILEFSPSSDSDFAVDRNSASPVFVNSSPVFENSSPVFVNNSPVILNNEIRDCCSNDEIVTHYFEKENDCEVPQAIRDKKSKPDEKLCPCTDVTVGDLVFMVMSLALRHGLTWVAQCDILKMVSSVFKNREIPITKHSYSKVLNVNYDSEIDHHIYCNECNSYLGVKQKKEKGKKKTVIEKEKLCEVCNKKVSVSKAENYFVSLSIESQIKNYLLDEKFVDYVMKYRFERRSENTGDICDVYDGDAYKKLTVNHGPLSYPYNFSYNFFFDGVAYGKTSNKTIWPLYLTINELPFEERSNYLILAAVYTGSKDPDQNYFFRPFVKEANKLSSEGVSWIHNGESVSSLIFPLCCVCDSVARYQSLNLQSFHAEWGCTFCYKQSVRTRVGQRYTVSVPPECRSLESLRQDLEEVYNRRNETQNRSRTFRGVKGPCTLLKLNYFDVTSSFVVDYMHAILLGVAKTHTELILESTRKKMWIGMDNNIGMEHLKSKIDSRIKAVQSNTSIIRELRELKYLSLWRANEFKCWLITFALPCLSGLLKPKYLLHFGMLSTATAILLKKSQSQEELNHAHELLMFYSFFFQKYFGEENMLYNIHLLSHVVPKVFSFGPIWSHNSFMYESENRYLLQLCKSPFSVSLQISRKFLTFSRLSQICIDLVSCDASIQFSKNILNYKNVVRCERILDNSCVLLGKPFKCTLSEDDINQISDFIAPFHCCDCQYYSRIVLRKRLYCTSDYCEQLKNNDSFALLKSGACVIIKAIFKLPSSQLLCYVQYVVLDRALYFRNEHVSVSHMRKVNSYGTMTCISVESIADPCLILKVDGIDFVSSIPYGCSVE